jgi:hypothetical protein
MEAPKKNKNLKDKILYSTILLLTGYILYTSNMINVGIVDNSLIFSLNIGSEVSTIK